MTTIIVPTPDTANNLKRCNKCGELKPTICFSKHVSNKDGLRSYCRSCIHNQYVENAEQIREYSRQYSRTHAEQHSKYMSEYRRINAIRIAEYDREYQRKYRQSDTGKAVQRTSKNRRRARKAGSSGAYTPAELTAIRAAQTDAKGRLICWRCGKPIKGTPHLDHWIPLTKGGANDAGNLHYMHARCNLSKSTKHPTEIGRLL